MSHLEEFKIVSDIQLGFRKSHSCETQLRITLEYLAKNLDHGKQSDINLLHFAKAFDNVLHQRVFLSLSPWEAINGREKKLYRDYATSKIQFRISCVYNLFSFRQLKELHWNSLI